MSPSTPDIPWQRRSSKAVRPCYGGMYGWVFCAKSWQLRHLVLQQVTDALWHPSRHGVEPPCEDPAGGRHLQSPLPYEIVYYRDQK